MRLGEQLLLVVAVLLSVFGVVTAIDVACNSVLTLEQAKDTLDQLNLKGFNEMEVSESSTILYKFRV